MAKLIYAAIASLDGYVDDTDGKFDWAAPDHEVHAFVNDLERPMDTYLYGRRMQGWPVGLTILRAAVARRLRGRGGGVAPSPTVRPRAKGPRPLGSMAGV